MLETENTSDLFLYIKSSFILDIVDNIFIEKIVNKYLIFLTAHGFSSAEAMWHILPLKKKKLTSQKFQVFEQIANCQESFVWLCQRNRISTIPLVP